MGGVGRWFRFSLLKRHLSYPRWFRRSMKYDFADWRLAFEVDLKMCSHDEFEGASSEVFKSSQALQMHVGHLDRDLKHIFLDLKGTFCRGYS